MGQSDVFGRKRLTVLNRTAAVQTGPTDYVLEDPGTSPEGEPSAVDTVRQWVIAALRTIQDPEIPLNVYDLGLVYRVDIGMNRRVEIDMTLTSPGCPVAGVLIKQVHDAVKKVPAVSSVCTRLVWDPPWTKDRMSEVAQLALGLL